MGSLKAHEHTHSDVKDYKFNTCQKTYNEASYLKKHYLTHIGVKDYTLNDDFYIKNMVLMDPRGNKGTKPNLSETTCLC